MSTNKEIKSPENPPKKRKRSIWIYLLLGLLTLLISAIAILSFKLNDIAAGLIKSYNDEIEGELDFSSISVNPFLHFPNTTVHFKDFTLCLDAKKGELDKDTLAYLAQLSLTVDLVKLIDSDIELLHSSFEDGFIHLEKSKKGDLNILQAFNKKKKANPSNTSSKNKIKSSKPKTAEKKFKERASIQLDKLKLEKIDLFYSNHEKKISLNLLITKLNAALSINGDSIHSKIKGNALLNKFSLPKFGLEDRTLELESKLTYNRKEELLTIEESIFTLDKFDLKLEGLWSIADSKEVDLKLEGVDLDFGVLGLVLSNEGLNQIQSGSSYFKGSIKGNFDEQIPQITLAFGLEDLQIDMPPYKQKISNLNMNGSFRSGLKADFSDAEVLLDELNAQLPDGYLKAELELKNLVKPKLNYLLDLQSELKGMDEIFRVTYLKGLKGQIKVFEQFQGVYNDSLNFFDEMESKSDIYLKKVSFNIPDMIQIDSLSGEFHRTENRLNIISMKVNTPESDLKLRGSTDTFLDLILGKSKEIHAELDVQSDTFNIPNQFAWAPGVASSLPFTLLNASLKFQMNTSTDQLVNFIHYPSIDFQIEDLKTNINGISAEFKAEKGQFIVGEEEESLHLEFIDFKVSAGNGSLKANANLTISDTGGTDLTYSAQLLGLNPTSFIPIEKDSMPDLIDGMLYGDLSGIMHFENDSTHINHLELNTQKMNFIGADSLLLTDLFIEADSIYFGPPLSLISFQSAMTAESIHSKSLHLKDINYEIFAKEGLFTIDPHQLKIFGNKGNGSLSMNPFADLPTYNFNYSVKEFSSEHLLKSLNQIPALSGNMDLEMNVSINSDSDRKIIQDMNGSLLLKGEGLELQGLDFDKFLKKYQKSQRFDLVDLGAIAVAGPIGLAITKGSDFAALAIGNKGEVTQISQLISEIEIENGRLYLEDVAFATHENRIAVKGWLDLATDSLEVSLAVLDANGCAVLEQELSGNMKDPDKSDVKLLGTLIGPITSLIKGTVGKDCEKFYSGQVAQPSYE